MPLPVIAAVLGRIGLARLAQTAAVRAVASGGVRKALAQKAYQATGSRAVYGAVRRGATGTIAHTARGASPSTRQAVAEVLRSRANRQQQQQAPRQQSQQQQNQQPRTPLQRLSDRVQQRINQITNNRSDQTNNTTNNNQTTTNQTTNQTTNTTSNVTNQNTTNQQNTANTYQTFNPETGQPVQQPLVPTGNMPVVNDAQIGNNYPTMGRNVRRGLAVMTLGATAAAGALVTLTNRAQAYGLRISESQRYLENYNAGIAHSFAQLELKRVFRNVDKGRATSESTKYLNENLNNLEQRMLPYQTFGQNVLNSLAGKILSGFDKMIQTAETVGKALPFGVGDSVAKALKDGGKQSGFRDSGLNSLFVAQDMNARKARPPQRGGGNP